MMAAHFVRLQYSFTIVSRVSEDHFSSITASISATISFLSRALSMRENARSILRAERITCSALARLPSRSPRFMRTKFSFYRLLFRRCRRFRCLQQARWGRDIFPRPAMRIIRHSTVPPLEIRLIHAQPATETSPLLGLPLSSQL